MPNLYLSKNVKTFFVRRERTADKKRYLYWLGHRTADQMSSEWMQVSESFYNDFRKEIKRFKACWMRKKPHCKRPACKVAPYCVCPCNRCK